MNKFYYQQGGSPMPNFWEAGLESLNFDMYKNAFDARTEYGNAFQNQQNTLQPPTPPKHHWYQSAAKQSRIDGKYQEELKAFNDKKNLATDSFKQSYNMMLPLGMLMQGQQGYMDYLSKPKENLQEEQGFYGFKQGGNVNKTGYTPGYASMNNSYNIIPSNNITMQNTPFPVLGIGSNGQQQMMYPGNNYNFKGSSHVTEIPMKKYQEGGPPSGQGLQKFEDYKPAEEDLLNIPQHALMEALTGRKKSPSEILYEDGALDSTKTSHKILGTLFDLGIDPLNYIAGPRNIGMKGEQLGLTTLGKYIQAVLTGDNIKDTYSGLAKGGSDKKYKKIDPQNDKKTKIENKQEGGEINQEPIPLQAEKGEWFSTPDGMLAKVKAKESHKKQDKDNVSDVLQPGSFIYSDDKKLIIDKTKKVKGIDLEEITFGRGPIEYKETEQTPLPEEIKFIDIMNKTKMTPAQIAAQVYAKYPSTDREKDAFSISANEQNKLSRTPYLAVLQELNKRKQTKQPQHFKYGGTVQHFQEGGYTQTPPGFEMPVVGENPTSTFSVPVNQDNIRASGSKLELTTKGDPYMYRLKSDGTYETKKKTSTGSWIKMNENQTNALIKQIEAGIFDANYKPKNVKPAATIRTKQDLDKHDNKVSIYTKPGYAFNVDLNHKVENVEGQYNNNPYVQYISNSQASQLSNQPSNPSSNYQFQVSDNQNTSDNMQAYGDPTTAQMFAQYQAPYAIVTGGALGRGISGLVGNAALGAGRVAGSGVGRIAGTAGSEGWTIIPSQGLLGQGAGAAIESGLGRSLLGQGSQQVLNIGSRIPQLAAYQQGGMLGMVKNMATKQSSQQPGNKTSGIGGGIMNMMSGLSNQQGNSQGSMYGGIKNMMNGMSNQPNNQSMYQPMNTFDSIYNQPTNNAITGLGYKDPMEQRDKAFRNQGMYNSNLYSQPTTTNNKMFNFEQGGNVPHFQAGGNSNQPTNNTRTGGAGGAAGPIGGIIGAVTDIVGMIAGNVRNDKNLKKARKMLEEDRLEQLRTNSTGTNVRMAGNMMNYASQDPAYEYLNLSNQYARGDNAYQNIGSNLDNAQMAAQNQAMTGSSGFMRNAASLGLSPHQAANYAASMQASAIGNNNQLGLNYANQRGSNIANQLGYNSRYDDMYSQDQQLGGASVRGNLNKLNSNMISGNINTGVDKINNDQAINSGYRANIMGLDNQAYTRFINNNAMMGNSFKNGFNSGQELYLNQQSKNNYDPRNSYGYTQENPYQIPAGPSSPSTGFNEQNPFNPYAIPYGPR